MITGGWDRPLNWVAHPLAFGIAKGAVFEWREKEDNPASMPGAFLPWLRGGAC
jgi:hypothetical protein